MFDAIVQDGLLYFCVPALVFLLVCFYKTRDKDILYFAVADIFYILGELCFLIFNRILNLPIDFIFFFSYYVTLYLFLKNMTKNLLKNPALKKHTATKTWLLLVIDFFIIETLSYLIFYYFDRYPLTAPPVIFPMSSTILSAFLYPVLDFVLLGYYVYINKIYVVSGRKAYLPLTASVLVCTIGDFLLAFEELFKVTVYGIGDYLQFFGLVTLCILLFLIKNNKTGFDYTTLDVTRDKTKFGNFTIMVNSLVIAYVVIYLYCLNHFADQLLLMNTVRESGIILLILSILRQNLLNYDTQRQLAELLKDARTDALTGLYTRKYAFNLMQSIFQSSRYFDVKISALMLDIDHFKAYNDTWGHLSGDYVLIHLSRIIQGVIGTSDIICRYGGEEILIFLPGKDQNSGKLMAEKIRNAIGAFDFHREQEKPGKQVTVSIGGATAGAETNNYMDLISQADAALYHAKETRNRTYWFSAADGIERR